MMLNMSDDAVPQSSIILYQTEDGRTRVQCRFENETIWLTQALIAELFDVTPQNVTLHLKRFTRRERSTSEQLVRITYKFDPRAGAT